MRILLHICCGVCAAAVAERLMRESHTVTGFFYNPNIYPEAEYARRFETARETAGRTGFELIEGEYDHGEWSRLARGHESEPEGGGRCALCFRMRLKGTHEYFSGGGFDLFTTTLTVSPLKDADTVNRIGAGIGGDRFLSADFKKKNGFKRAIELSKAWGLYRQDYCGCEYSVRGAR
ncbi:MAG: epoxyqueuosine reductase QueH [Candidatus Omnitrophica bacterium]|nr:epoxyqueuosine reductase QueH [Candidatus Omnitrophota bacterium]